MRDDGDVAQILPAHHRRVSVGHAPRRGLGGRSASPVWRASERAEKPGAGKICFPRSARV
jgi:hypothetical protein